MSHLLTEIPTYASKRISEAIRGDPDTINLSITEPWFGPPGILPEILAGLSTRSHLAEHVGHYADSLGLLELRQAIAARYARLYGMAVDPASEVLVTTGGSEAVTLAILAASDIGDEVLLGDPSYILYSNLAALLGRTVIRVPTGGGRGFHLTADMVAARISSRARLILVNSPENPTGSMCDRATMTELVTLARERDLLVMHDEVYDAFTLGTEHVPARQVDAGASIMVNGLSKKYAMPGWRLGWLVGPAALVQLAAKAHNYLALSTSGIAQAAAAKILNDPGTTRELDDHAADVLKRLRSARLALSKMPGIELPEGLPQGGLFLFPNVRALGTRLSRPETHARGAGEVVAEWMLSGPKVAVVPGSVYGHEGRDHVRIVVGVAAQQLDEAMRRLTAATNRLMG
jgi:aminotransferase